MTIPRIACLADGGCYVAPVGSPAAVELSGLTAIRRAHDPAALGTDTGADTAELLHTAGAHATAAGWVRRTDGAWLCPRHAAAYSDSDPKRFTVRECLARHRTAHHD